RSSGIALLVYAGLMVLTWVGLARSTTGFRPSQDKLYLVAFAELPDAASLVRTEDVIKRISELALKQPCVENAIAFAGLSINGFT
ncbi:efflux RND transporter permease subunit, partial [Pseudomonas syringae group genomosp. 7]|uniref:efflux RND transporter permease subunit n=1 Tax=Pseudomonas syringae group genomosp. 7 TaxID=251699 RepID=UPI00376F4796